MAPRLACVSEVPARLRGIVEGRGRPCFVRSTCIKLGMRVGVTTPGLDMSNLQQIEAIVGYVVQ